jgi:hypothetical protein
VDRRRIDTNAIDLCYEYPYQWSDTDGKIKHWRFVLPVDECTTRVFFLFYFFYSSRSTSRYYLCASRRF